MKKILVVEDDPIVAHVYRSRLEKEGFAVEVAADGQAGFYSVHEGQPDAILLDLMLPKMNGLELLRKIRVQPKYQQVPVIVFTNAYVPPMVHDAMTAGATAVFNKSTLTPRQIVDALHMHLYPGVSSATGGTLPDTVLAGAAQPTSFASSAAAPSAPVSTTAPPSRLAAMLLSSPSFHSAPPPDESSPTLTQAFFAQVPELLTALRKHLAEFRKSQDEASRMEPLQELYRIVHSLSSRAGLAGLRPMAQMATALEALLKDLLEKPKNGNPSTVRTVAQAVDFLASLCDRRVPADLADKPALQILVVDDDLLSRRAMTMALQKAFLNCESVETPEAAIARVAEQAYDMIFLDVLMPGTPGFVLCEKIRASGPNKTTPVVFVTSQTDFTTRTQSALSGGNDLIAKPFLFIEVAVKAMTFALRGRLQKLPH